MLRLYYSDMIGVPPILPPAKDSETEIEADALQEFVLTVTAQTPDRYTRPGSGQGLG